MEVEEPPAASESPEKEAEVASQSAVHQDRTVRTPAQCCRPLFAMQWFSDFLGLTAAPVGHFSFRSMFVPPNLYQDVFVGVVD